MRGVKTHIQQKLSNLEKNKIGQHQLDKQGYSQHSNLCLTVPVLALKNAANDPNYTQTTNSNFGNEATTLCTLIDMGMQKVTRIKPKKKKS